MGLQFPRGLAAQAVQLAHGQQHIAGQGILQLAQFEGRAPQSPKLLSQALGRERLLFRPGERHRRVELNHVAKFITRDESERLAGQAMHFHPDRSLEPRGVAFVALAQAPIQLGVAGLPDLVAHMNALEVNVPPPKAAVPRAGHSGLRDSAFRTSYTLPPCSSCSGWPASKTTPSPGFSGACRFNADPLALDPGHLAQEHAALLAEAAMDELLVIGAAKPPGVEPAREGHLHVVAILTGGRLWLITHPASRVTQPVNGLAVNAGDVGDVFGRFEPPLDLQGGHADTSQLRQDLQPGQILRAEQILPVAQRHQFAVRHQIVRHAAGLRALAAIGRTPTQRLARQALAGVGDTKRAVNEDLQGEGMAG